MRQTKCRAGAVTAAPAFYVRDAGARAIHTGGLGTGRNPLYVFPSRKGGHGDPALAAALLSIGKPRGFFKDAEKHWPGKFSGLRVLVRRVVRSK